MLPSVACGRFQKLLDIFQLGNATTLRKDMDECDCIISGSAALYLFHPTSFTPADIDFYVPHCGVLDFGYALYRRGYEPAQSDSDAKQPCYPSDAVISVMRLYKPGVTHSLNLVVTRDKNPFSAITQFHSTLVMNAITSNGVLSLYPLLTLSGRGVINVNNAATRRCFQKYISRGFELSFYSSAWSQFSKHDCASSAYCSKARRSINDGDVLTVPFDPTVAVVNKFSPFSWHLRALVCDLLQDV